MIVEFCKTDADTLKLADVTDFEWDEVYFFNGYTNASPEEAIFKINREGNDILLVYKATRAQIYSC